MSAADIEQMNKLRKSLGLPLLTVSGQPPPASEGPTFKSHSASDDEGQDDDDDDGEVASTLETREAAGYGNWQALQDEEKRKIARERRKKEIQRARDAVARSAKLQGKGLGEADDDGDVDAKAWLKGHKKRQHKIERERADRLAQELAEREAQAAIEYSSKDLAGVQVAHEIGDFENGESEHILTLKDQEIGNDDDSDQDDILENSDMVAKDNLKEKLDLKKKRKVYDVNDDSEQALLAQYDDKKRKAFTLDGQGATMEERDAKRQQIGEKLKNSFSLDELKPDTVSDYMEIKIKKPKKEKKKSKRQKVEDEDDIFPVRSTTNGDAMDLDSGSVAMAPGRAPAKSRFSEDNFNDDDDLANALSRSRRAVLKKQKRRPEDIIKQLKQEEEQATPDVEAEGGLVLDDTTVFLDNISSRPREEILERSIQKSVEQGDAESPDDQEAPEDQPMGEAYSGIENEADLLDRLRREQSAHTPEVPHAGLEEEKSMDQGLGAALGLLRQRGLVKESDPGDKNKLYKDRQQFIIEARLRENDAETRARLQRERDRQSGKLTGLSVKEREEHARWQNTQREHQTSIQAAAAFNREYKPDVNLKYIDDDGRSMNQKEAFKHLSHMFHGKGSGKMKTEKHLKKVADEKKRESASILDSSQATGMSNAQGAMGKKNKEAGVRLG